MNYNLSLNKNSLENYVRAFSSWWVRNTTTTTTTDTLWVQTTKANRGKIVCKWKKRKSKQKNEKRKSNKRKKTWENTENIAFVTVNNHFIYQQTRTDTREFPGAAEFCLQKRIVVVQVQQWIGQIIDSESDDSSNDIRLSIRRQPMGQNTNFLSWKFLFFLN